MQLELSLPDSDVQAILDLHHWLSEEPLVRRFGALHQTGSGTPDRMGIGLDVLTLVVGAGLSTSQLLLSLLQWRQARKPAPNLAVTRIGPDGVTIWFEATDSEQLAALVRRIEAG